MLYQNVGWFDYMSQQTANKRSGRDCAVDVNSCVTYVMYAHTYARALYARRASFQKQNASRAPSPVGPCCCSRNGEAPSR